MIKKITRLFITSSLIFSISHVQFPPPAHSFFDSIGETIKLKTAQASSDSEGESNDQDLWKKYKQYKKYKNYKKYKKYKEQYAFKSKAERQDYKNKYKLYKSNKKKYAQYYSQYIRYRNYKNKYSKYSKYKKYSKYNKSRYKKYGSSKYKNGYDRYEAGRKNQTVSSSTSGSLGPDIKVGILSFDKSYAKDHAMTIKANTSYSIKDKNSNTIATVSGSTEAKVKYASSGKVRVYGDGFDSTVDDYVDFVAASGSNNDMIFDVEPKSFDDYRGRIQVRYSDNSDKLWAINILPLEHYTWGMGEITGTGDMGYNRVMTVVYRTYGYWKIQYSTKYAKDGFTVDATAGNQIYYGYDWETSHSRIQSAAEDTRGKIVKYKGDVAITPYSSSTDGRTRSWKERWGSSNYPYCKSVDDPYGKVSGAGSIAGNHMVGLSARGALVLAGDHGWDYEKILKYYYTGIDIVQEY
ncbi:MAG: hypothetical protein ABIC19_04705 [Patescibacteria group bacterium]|nr:hypothetical protein [Patescibacteria group bacterium]